MTIPPIETRYAGCRFRSRLEARWAVFFDHLGIRWEYEPQGYRLGADNRAYLPDFWLPDQHILVEVKGDHNALDLGLLGECLSIGGVYWALILGPVPTISPGAVPCHSLLFQETDFRRLGDFSWEDAPHEDDNELLNNLGETLDEPARSALLRTRHRATTMAIISPAVFVEGRSVYAFPVAFPNTEAANPEQILNPAPCDFVVVNPRIQAAYEAARSARFEHGESG